VLTITTYLTARPAPGELLLELEAIARDPGLPAPADARLREPGAPRVHEGNSQAIDHLLVSSVLLEALQVVDVVHRNAEYPEVMKNPDGTTVHRASDHDPLVAIFAVPD